MSHIFIKENAIPEKFCDEIVHKLNTSKLIKPKPPLENFYEKIHVNVYEQNWRENLFDCLTEYKLKHPFVDSEYHSRWGVNEFCNYKKFVPNQSYANEHCEQGGREEDGSNLRMLGWLFYCNTVLNGGQTHFPQQKFLAPPKKGTVIIWPAAWTHSHYGKVAPEEHKYIVNGWASYVTE